MTPERRIEEVQRKHREELHEEGVCICGWHADAETDYPAHVAAAVVAALGEVFYKRGRYFFGEVLSADHPQLPFVKCLCGAEFTAEATP